MEAFKTCLAEALSNLFWSHGWTCFEQKFGVDVLLTYKLCDLDKLPKWVQLWEVLIMTNNNLVFYPNELALSRTSCFWRWCEYKNSRQAGGKLSQREIPTKGHFLLFWLHIWILTHAGESYIFFHVVDSQNIPKSSVLLRTLYTSAYGILQNLTIKVLEISN